MYKTHREIEPVFRTTTPLEYADFSGGGTGFYLNYDDSTYVVTNKHVVSPDSKEPASVRAWVRENEDFSRFTTLDIPLRDGYSYWYEHPDGEDLVVLPIEETLVTLSDYSDSDRKTGSLAFSTEDFVHDNIQFSPRVSVLGYPENIIDSNLRLPVRRNALLATPYGTSFDGNPFFLTDARMHKGMSGAPVVIDDSTAWMSSDGDVPTGRFHKPLLIGIHSGTLYDTKADTNEAGTARYDLNISLYPRLLREILVLI